MDHKEPREHKKHKGNSPRSYGTISPRLNHVYYQESISRIASGPNELVSIIKSNERKNYRWGIFFLVIAVGTWILGLELVNSVMKDGDYAKPWLCSFVTGSFFSILLIPEVLLGIRCLIGGGSLFDGGKGSREEDELISRKSGNDGLSYDGSGYDGSRYHSTGENFGVHEDGFDEFSLPEEEELTRKEVVTLAIQIAFIYFGYNSMVMTCLKYTSASNQTVLGTTTSMFTLLIETFLQIDKFSIKKVLCIAASMSGVLLINYSESRETSDDDSKYNPKNPSLGNSLAVVGAFMYSLYLIVVKVQCGTGNRTTDQRKLFGLVGVFSFIVGIPLLFLVHYLGIEKFDFPPHDDKVLAAILINGFCSVISDYTTILAMLLTSPLVTSLSLTSSIPITIVIDYILVSVTGSSSKASTKGFIYFLGISSILLSVILINISAKTEQDLVEKFIGGTIEDAIQEDEVLSPVLAPLLQSISKSAQGTPLINLPSLLSSPDGKSRFLKTPRSPFHRHVLSKFKTVPDLQLGESSQAAKSPLAQHHSFEDTCADNDYNTSRSILLYGGTNHEYHVKSLDSDARLNKSGSKADDET